ncbi:bifunctional tRNA (5-methylaminomethyl-2-thiouridine)(34)-methyltransferase MnmD/FAD-dependent 5-carboxymethylaminomethyl-2-thiouridine(34) oxidoreductase MnmC [Chitinibacter sp. SCUT-21]|uniref:bifunctional tRNA (5-methylaminomethyl-2-thiouridine)(34)-methyltransferase MnmD/FAD-dependent 5-carboxymethylaminomethyl-2-thiouridine(34) oxidoreductase MnmC n=1 Tax=Chitinibacter sp. SCUT-21 TaxID=2970891 RepID=UPI0035A66B1A
MPIIPAQLEFAADGQTLYSSQFDDIYHASHDAIQQAEAVFLAGNQLPQRWQGKDCFSIIETGFGQGLNFLTTWLKWRNDEHRSQRLHFISVELHPFTRDSLQQLHQSYPELSELSAQLLEHWPHLTPGFHRIWLDQGQVSLTLLFGDTLNMLHEVSGKVDAIYLAGFSPTKNPEMWSLPVFKALWRLCTADTTLASYTIASHVLEGLHEAGFTTSTAVDIASKRQMLIGYCARLPKPPRVIVQQQPYIVTEKSAIIIGAGIAGCATAASLAERGWSVLILDAEHDIAQRASGNHVGLCHPTFSKDDNALARLSRAGFSLTRQKLLHLAQSSDLVQFGFAGQFQAAQDDEQETLMQKTVQTLHFPASLVQYLNQEQAYEKLGTTPPRGGWWFEQGAWLNPKSLCVGYIAKEQNLINFQGNTHVECIEFINDRWHLFSHDAHCIATTKTLIIANATAATQLISNADLPLSESWRAVTQVPAELFASALPSYSGKAYLTAAWNGWRSLGAAALINDNTDAARDANLAALTDLLPDVQPPQPKQTYTRVCARPNSLDRLPLVGALHAPLNKPSDREAIHQLFQMPRQPGLYTVLGFGSRGITWHALAAEIIACQINNEPLPIERSLVNAIDPARFELRALRKGKK